MRRGRDISEVPQWVNGRRELGRHAHGFLTESPRCSTGSRELWWEEAGRGRGYGPQPLAWLALLLADRWQEEAPM